MLKLQKDKKIIQIALLISCASVLQIVESLFPHPIPGVRLGLANIITLVALVNLGLKVSIEVAVLRVIVSSFILGTFMSPAFILSFSGALVSTLVMGLFYKLSISSRRIYFSLIGISLLGAVVHNLVQISLVYFFLIKHKGIFLLLPWLGISAVIMGWITGLVASQVCRRLENTSEEKPQKQIESIEIPSLEQRHYVPLDSPVHVLSPVIKILFVFFLALLLLISNNPSVYIFSFIFLLAAIHISKISFAVIFLKIRRLSLFIFLSFFMPVLFNAGGEILLHLGPVEVTREGLSSGITFVSRIILLMISASLLIKVTSPEDLATGLGKLLSPLKIFGISGKRIAAIITLSMSSIPVFLEKSRYFIKNQKFSGNIMKRLLSAMSSLVLMLYSQTK